MKRAATNPVGLGRALWKAYVKGVEVAEFEASNVDTAWRMANRRNQDVDELKRVEARPPLPGAKEPEVAPTRDYREQRAFEESLRAGSPATLYSPEERNKQRRLVPVTIGRVYDRAQNTIAGGPDAASFFIRDFLWSVAGSKEETWSPSNRRLIPRVPGTLTRAERSTREREASMAKERDAFAARERRAAEQASKAQAARDRDLARRSRGPLLTDESLLPFTIGSGGEGLRADAARRASTLELNPGPARLEGLDYIEEVTGHAYGQTDAYKAFVDRKRRIVAAQVTYAIFRKQAHIGMIETHPEYRRRGLAAELLRRLSAEAGGYTRIRPGYLTDDGGKLWGSLVPSWRLERRKAGRNPGAAWPAVIGAEAFANLQADLDAGGKHGKRPDPDIYLRSAKPVYRLVSVPVEALDLEYDVGGLAEGVPEPTPRQWERIRAYAALPTPLPPGVVSLSARSAARLRKLFIQNGNHRAGAAILRGQTHYLAYMDEESLARARAAGVPVALA